MDVQGTIVQSYYFHTNYVEILAFIGLRYCAGLLKKITQETLKSFGLMTGNPVFRGEKF